jgi:PAS domain S-box-containing protein
MPNSAVAHPGHDVAKPATASPERQPPRDRRWLLAAVGLVLFHLSQGLADEISVWQPAIALGMVLVAWLGPWFTAPLAADLVLFRLLFRDNPTLSGALLEGSLIAAQIGLTWIGYHRVGRGMRRLNDPRSATLFLILVPGVLAVLFAMLRVLAGSAAVETWSFWTRVSSLWISAALGILILAPPLLVLATPWLARQGLALAEPRAKYIGGSGLADWTWGDIIEVGSLAMGTSILGMVLAILQMRQGEVSWQTWGVSLLLVVWGAVRQGLRGGALAASLGALTTLTTAWWLGANATHWAGWGQLQGDLLAQCAAALLVGASAGWVRASEARYRQVVGHIPVMLYSVRSPRGISGEAAGASPTPGQMARILLNHAEITLASPASRSIFGCEPEDLLGPFSLLVERIVPADRELITAALAQLSLQKKPVTCEYRVQTHDGERAISTPVPHPNRIFAAAMERWARDTLTPHYNSDGQLDGWEGVVEDITEQRLLAYDLRRTSGMLHALIANLPAGVFFVHGPMGTPVLVNHRARQLLGRREDLAAGIEHLPEVYRLHGADGSLYSWEELPVSKALRLGTTTMVNDIVVHRLDGRKVPLVSWAAPVDLGGQGKPEAAVWVLEDLTALQQAEVARRESEARLRTIIETMAEGVIVQGQDGTVVECNPAACAILGVEPRQLLAQNALAPEARCIREDGSAFLRDEQPDRRALQTGQAIRDVVMGILRGDESTRWVLVNAMPLPVIKTNTIKPARVVTTFADITAHRQALNVIRSAKEKYQDLVDHLPLMLLQFDGEGRITYMNPATQQITGYSAEELSRPEFWNGLLLGEDLPRFRKALERTLAGYSAHAEFRYRAREGDEKVGYALAQPHVHDGQVIGTTCLVVDMTLQRRLEQELQRSQRLQLVGRLASGTVHDFNNLLTAMMGLAVIARKDLPAEHPVADELDRIVHIGEQAAHLAGQLLTFSKKRQIVPQEVEVNTAVVHTLKLLRGVMPDNIVAKSELMGGDLKVRADDTQLKQVLMNLCLNARDAMPGGGTLMVRTEARPGPPSGQGVPIMQPGGPTAPWVVLTVEDTGQGMSEAVQARIFEPFFSTKERGSGLGLAVVRQVVEGMGGRIEVWSQPDQGTRMSVWLPAVVSSDSRATSHSQVAVAEAGVGP